MLRVKARALSPILVWWFVLLLVGVDLAIAVPSMLRGNWLWALVYGVALLAAGYTWLALRTEPGPARAAVDRMIIWVLFFAMGVAMVAW